jgi:hypothetical protein
MVRRVALVKTDVSEESSVSIIRVRRIVEPRNNVSSNYQTTLSAKSISPSQGLKESARWEEYYW